MNITVVIPSIVERSALLERALASVKAQTLQPFETIVEFETGGNGAAITRQQGLDRVTTEWVAFLDDDDEFLPHHLETLYEAADRVGADLVWPWFNVQGGRDPFPMHRGRQWDPEDPHQIPITVLARTAALRAVGGFRPVEAGPTDRYGNRAGEDWDLWLRLSAAGYCFYHVNAVTWTWHHHGRNTSGLASRARSSRSPSGRRADRRRA